MLPLSPWLFIPLYVALCAALYRWRGGGIFALLGETPKNKHTQIRRVSYAIFTAAPLAAAGLVWWEACLVAVILFVAQLAGNGRPIGACGGWQDKPLEELAPFDWLLRPVRPARRWYLAAGTVMGKHKSGPNKGEDIIYQTAHKGFFIDLPYGKEPRDASRYVMGEYTPKWRLQAWGILWFALWGISTGVLLNLLPSCKGMVLLFAFTGCIYHAVLKRKGPEGWGRAEWCNGALHGLMLALSFTV